MSGSALDRISSPTRPRRRPRPGWSRPADSRRSLQGRQDQQQRESVRRAARRQDGDGRSQGLGMGEPLRRAGRRTVPGDSRTARSQGRKHHPRLRVGRAVELDHHRDADRRSEEEGAGRQPDLRRPLLEGGADRAGNDQGAAEQGLHAEHPRDHRHREQARRGNRVRLHRQPEQPDGDDRPEGFRSSSCSTASRRTCRCSSTRRTTTSSTARTTSRR